MDDLKFDLIKVIKKCKLTIRLDINNKNSNFSF